MKSYITEILETDSKYQFIAGFKRRSLPKNHKFYPEHKMVLTLVEHTTDINTLTKRTKNNVLKLSELYKIKWIYILKYSVVKEHPGSVQRHSWIIYGMWNNKPVTFFRKETTNPTAGSTGLYFGYGLRIQVCKLFNPQESFQHVLLNRIKPEYKQHWVFVHQFKKLYKYIKTDELERIFVLYN